MLISAAILAIFVYGMIAAMLGTILPDLSDRFRLTPTQNGTIAFSQALGLMIASLGVGPLLDTEGDKVGLILGLAFIAIALFSLPRSKGFRSIVFLLFLLGVGGGIVVTGANALVSGVTEAHRATALNLVNLFFGLGGLATPFISANLFKRNWVRLCYTVAALTVACARRSRPSPRCPRPSGTSGFILADAGSVLGRPLLFMLGLFLFLYVSCEVGVWNWLPRHLIAQGIPESRALNILSLGFALGLLDRPRRRLPHPHPRIRGHGDPGSFHRHGHHHISDAPHREAHRCIRAGVYRRPLHGSGLSHHSRHGRQCLSAHGRHRHRLCHHLWMGRPRCQLPCHWSHRRRRSVAPEKGSPPDSRVGSPYGRNQPGHLVRDPLAPASESVQKLPPLRDVLKGHDFSRAVNATKINVGFSP